MLSLFRLKLLLAVLMFVALTSCAQNKNISMDNITKTLNIYKQVKTFDYQPRYYFRKESYGCSYELYVNDVPVSIDFAEGNATGVTAFTDYILRSGKQQLTVKVYPPVIEGFDKKLILEKWIEEDAVLKIEIFHEDFRNHKETSVLKFEIPKPGINIPYLEFKLPFDAKVPYNLSGWTQSQDLSKEDNNKLKGEVLLFHKDFENFFYENKLNDILSMTYNRELEIAQAYFLSNESDSKNNLDMLKEDLKDIKEFLLYDDCKLTFYGNGKLVGLVRQSIKNYGDNGIMFLNKNNEVLTYGLLLHRPKAGGPLEIIR